jgi:hypothetical protein
MEPDAELAKVLDECLDRINEGKPIDVCIAASPRLHDKVAPLLYTGYYMSTLPKVQPSEEFRRTAKGRLMARLQEEEKLAVKSKPQAKPAASFFREFGLAMQQVWQTIAGAKRIAVPVAIGLVLIIVSAFSIGNFISPAPALADGCTLSILSGTVEITGADGTLAGADGMTLDAGTRVKTGADSSALLTFFDGSTLEIKPDTEIEIQQLESGEGKAVTIVMKQWVGRTWSTVVKMADKGSRYEIDTPSAVALVRGTQFLVDVDETGRTVEHTMRGLVSVSAQGEEVLVPPGQATSVESGTPPTEPENAPEPEDAPPPQPEQGNGNQGGASNWAQNYNDNGNGGNSEWGQSNGNQGGFSDQAQDTDKGNASDWGQDNGNKGGASDWGQSNGNDENNGNENNNSGGNDNASSSGNGNAGGNSGNDNSNAGGNSGNDNSNAGGNSGNDNSNAGGNSGNDNSNAGGNSGNDNSNAGGNSDNDNSNAGGNSGNDNSNAGGNSGNDNSNAGGNSGNDNSNAGGNSGNDNSNAGGNSDNDNSNAGGNSGNDNSNAGGNGNSHAGGNGHNNDTDEDEDE